MTVSDTKYVTVKAKTSKTNFNYLITRTKNTNLNLINLLPRLIN